MKVKIDDQLEVKDAGFGLGSTQLFFTSADATTAVPLTDYPEPGKRIAIIDIKISCLVAMPVVLQMETSENMLARFYVDAKRTVVLSPRSYLKADEVDKRIFIKTGATGNLSVTVTYFSEV